MICSNVLRAYLKKCFIQRWKDTFHHDQPFISRNIVVDVLEKHFPRDELLIVVKSIFFMPTKVENEKMKLKMKRCATYFLKITKTYFERVHPSNYHVHTITEFGDVQIVLVCYALLLCTLLNAARTIVHLTFDLYFRLKV